MKLISILAGLILLGTGVASQLTHPGEETAKFLPPDTEGYFTINLQPGLEQGLKFKDFVNNFWDNPSVEENWAKLTEELEMVTGHQC